ncbi:Probable sensor-like histidine kinase YehU [[Eubacterium] contortum]|uniref:Probable sensor-like histidine kinase YehU n=1 Tax=Faecalicatena contorta TaxID=39482 RepID=A0A174G858_9FIRM|nr:sensor histidine kinase [Faecalicatena contorta]MBS6763236.1 sensor histidine kinase [Clostridium sp.]CUO58553.1 Probable sensor-like histidine kinase YehU [[Eubacterium] contortum] [Faecalicatena contorta]
MKCRKSLRGDCIKGEKSILHGLYIQAGFAVAGTLLFLLLLLWARDFKTAVLLLVYYVLFLSLLWVSVRNTRRMHRVILQKAESEKKAVEAELEQKRQQLLALETQINPHFLYNTLDTFRGLALENGDRHLSDMIEALSVMFKYSVNYDVEMVSMNAELNYLSKYIQLQQLRFPDRFEYQEVINCTPEQLLLEMCPRFVLQPLVENAIRHGLRNVRRGGCITVSLEIREGDFYIDVEDNGCGMSQQQVACMNQRFRKPEQPEDGNRMAEVQEDTKERKGQGGIGLGNVNKRIKMFCGEEYGLKVMSTPEVGTQIEVCLPLYKEAREE